MIAATDWPKFDPALIKSDTMTIGVQVNGKLRGTLDVATDIPEDALKADALALDGVVRALEGREPKRVIVVPRRIVNIVA